MSLKKLWHRAVNRAYDDSYELARVGKHNPDASTTLAVVGRADYLWVTLADQTTVQARNDAGVPQTIDLEVWVRAETNAGGGPPTYVIEGRSAAGLLSAPTTTPPSGVLAHATSHKHGGTDEIATATPAANAIPKADGSGTLDAWVTGVDDVATQITAAATDDTIVDTDIFGYLTGGVLVKSAWSNLKAVLKTHFDTLYNLYVHPNHSGDVTSVGDGATTIANDAVTNAKAANMAQSTIKGRAAGAGTGDPTDLTATQVRTVINVEDGADVTDAGNIASTIDGTADLGAPADTDKLAAVRGGSLGTILISALKTMLNGLYVALTGDQTVAGIKSLTSMLRAQAQVRVETTGFTSTGLVNPLLVIGDTNDVGLFTGAVAPSAAVVNRATAGNSVARFLFNAGDGQVYGYFIADRAGAGLANDALPAAGMGVVVRTNHPLFFVTNNIERARIDSTGLGIGTTSSQGVLHTYANGGGHLVVTKTGVNSTAQTIIPDGTGDVLYTLVGKYAFRASNGNVGKGDLAIDNGASQTIYNVGGETLVVAVAANGSVTVQRTAGATLTFTVMVNISWI